MSEETKNLNHKDPKQKKGDDALKGLSMKERKKVLEERKEKRRKKLYIAIGAVVAVLVAALLFFDSGVLQRSMTAITIGDKSYSVAEMDYYYYSNYNSASTYATYYGLDTSKSLKEQEIYEGTTWYEYFLDSAKHELTDVSILAQEAEKEGYTLSEEGQKEVEHAMAHLSEYCDENGYSVKYYLQNTYGRYMNEKIYQEIALEYQLAQEYQEKVTQSYEKTDKEINKYYKKHAAELDTFVYQAYEVPVKTETKTNEDGETVEPTEKETKAAEKKAKKGAEALEAALKANDEKKVQELVEEYDCTDYSNRTYSSFSSYGFSDWLTDDDRTNGDSTTIKDETESAEEDEDATLNGYYVVRFDKRYLDEYHGATFRNILVTAEAAQDEDGETKTDKDGNTIYDYDAAKEEAETLQKTWKDNGGDADALGELAEENSDDSASYGNHGQYENASKEDVTDTLNAWLFDEERKEGDTALLKDEDAQGYQLVYFESYSEKYYWQEVSRSALQQEDYDQWYEETEEGYEDTITTSFMYRFV